MKPSKLLARLRCWRARCRIIRREIDGHTYITVLCMGFLYPIRWQRSFEIVKEVKISTNASTRTMDIQEVHRNRPSRNKV